ncbi:MAG TPA: hypothetical protein VGQ83_02625 [Polyangia bacterium]|jgi:hypothetical protein
MRTVAWGLLAILLAACGAPPPVVRTTTQPVPARPAPAWPEGWWIETADELNAGDVGTGMRATADGPIIVTTSGRVQRPSVPFSRVAPREWRFRIDGHDGTVRQPAADALIVETRGKRITFRRATDEESRQLEARAQAPSAP